MAKTYEEIKDQGGLGTIYVGGSQTGTTAAQKAEKVYARKTTAQGKIVQPKGGFFSLGQMDGFDVAFMDVVGEDISIDLTGGISRTYTMVIRGVIPAQVKVPANVQLSGYPHNQVASVGIHKDQIVVLEITLTEEKEWFGTVHGETDGVVLGVQIVKDGPVYVPDSDGNVKIPVDEMIESMEKNLKEFAEAQALYWN